MLFNTNDKTFINTFNYKDINNSYDCNIVIELPELIELSIINNHTYINYNNFFLIIHNIEELIYIQQTNEFNYINNYLFKYDFIDHEEVQFLFFINKRCYLIDENLNDDIYQTILLNPIIYGIYKVSSFFIHNYINFKYNLSYQHEIKNMICNINVNKIITYLNYNDNIHLLITCKVKLVFGKFLIYNIFNLPNNLSDLYINDTYKFICESLGHLTICHPYNNKDTTKSYSRDIKFDPSAKELHFFSSNRRQPMHNDYAYYPSDKSPDWLMLYCIKPSEYGGITSLISNNRIKHILKKYNNELYNKINVYITYKYNDYDSTIIHNKLLFDIVYNISNWNYFQLDSKLNNNDVIEIKEQFHCFLKDFITDAKIYDIEKKWNRGDCLIFNDHLVMHERSSFHGERHLKDLTFIDNTLKLYD
jgi:hypothetical protein